MLTVLTGHAEQAAEVHSQPSQLAFAAFRIHRFAFLRARHEDQLSFLGDAMHTATAGAAVQVLVVHDELRPEKRKKNALRSEVAAEPKL